MGLSEDFSACRQTEPLAVRLWRFDPTTLVWVPLQRVAQFMMLRILKFTRENHPGRGKGKTRSIFPHLLLCFSIGPLHVIRQTLSQPFGYFHFRKGVRAYTHCYILPLYHEFLFVHSSEALVTPGDGTLTEFDDPDFHGDLVPIAYPALKISLEMDSGQRDIPSVYHLGIINSDFGAEEFFHGKMEVMYEARIVDDTGVVNVTKANLYQLLKRHGLNPSFHVRPGHPE